MKVLGILFLIIVGAIGFPQDDPGLFSNIFCIGNKKTIFSANIEAVPNNLERWTIKMGITLERRSLECVLGSTNTFYKDFETREQCMTQIDNVLFRG